jgi:glutathione S-transferase
VQALTGSFVIRLVTFTKSGVYPANIPGALAEQAPKFWAWAEAVAAHPNVRSIFDEKALTEATKSRLAKARGQE